MIVYKDCKRFVKKNDSPSTCQIVALACSVAHRDMPDPPKAHTKKTDLHAGCAASHVHRYTSYLTTLKTRVWSYRDSERFPARDKQERRVYWPDSSPS